MGNIAGGSLLPPAEVTNYASGHHRNRFDYRLHPSEVILAGSYDILPLKWFRVRRSPDRRLVVNKGFESSDSEFPRPLRFLTDDVLHHWFTSLGIPKKYINF